MGTTPPNPLNAGDTAWVLASSALVLLMTAPGLALFYGGMVRRKNVLGVLMQCFMCLALISVLWVVYGYSLAFGKGISGIMNGGFMGGLDWFMLKGVGQEVNADYAGTIPHLAFMIFQCMFAVITPALIIGSYAERMKFSSFLVFTTLWLTFVYCPIAHMVWGIDGWLHKLGSLDFAGGTVVHMNAGVAGLVTALYLGKRVGTDKPGMHNIPFVVLGASLLWFGWFGFNAGSALAANGLAAHAFVTTNTATAAAALSWAIMEWIFAGKPTTLGAASGAVAGLVAITPACGFVDIGGALWIGFLVSVFCYCMVAFVKPKLGYDDTLDAFGVHGIGGFWGAMATGLFATKLVNSAGNDGLFHGNPGQLWLQFCACATTIVYCGIVTWVICFIVDKTMGIRADQEEEIMGLDLSQHHERAYTILD